jgi:hypothetical protein
VCITESPEDVCAWQACCPQTAEGLDLEVETRLRGFYKPVSLDQPVYTTQVYTTNYYYVLVIVYATLVARTLHLKAMEKNLFVNNIIFVHRQTRRVQ